MLASDLFAASKIDGWVQVTSSTSGLGGYYLAGDFASALGVEESSPALGTQVIPVVRDDQTTKPELVVLNSGLTSGTVTLNLFNARGDQAGATISRTIAAHGAVRLAPSDFAVNLPPDPLSSRISATVPVSATAILNRSGALSFAPAHRLDQPPS